MTDMKLPRQIKLKHINDIASQLGIDAEKLFHYGKYKAKLPIDLIDEEKIKKSNLVLVTAMSPTPAVKVNNSKASAFPRAWIA